MKKYSLFLVSSVLVIYNGCNIENELDINEANSSVTWYQPKIGETWRIQENKYLTDKNSSLFFIDMFKYSLEDIYSLKLRGSKVICSFSAGEFDSKNNFDAHKFPATGVGNFRENEADVRWIDINNATIKTIMLERIDYAKNKNCDGVRLRDVDLYNHDNEVGFKTSMMSQVAFNVDMIKKAHSIGLTIGFNNVNEQIANLKSGSDFLTSEECYLNNNCFKYEDFTKLNKPVFNIEYNSIYSNDAETLEDMCIYSKAFDIQTIVSNLDDLNGSYKFNCNDISVR